MKLNNLTESRKVLTTLICCDIITAALRTLGNVNTADRATISTIVMQKFAEAAKKKEAR